MCPANPGISRPALVMTNCKMPFTSRKMPCCYLVGRADSRLVRTSFSSRTRRRPCLRFVWTAQMVAYLTIVAPLALRGQQSEPGPYSVAAVRAFLYFNQKDSVSANIIDNPSLHDFFNAPTGGRPPGSPSEEILITVEIAGERNGYASDRRL